MFDLFKMYFYRVLRQKSLYVTWGIALIFELLSFQMTEGGYAEHFIDTGVLFLPLACIVPAILFSGELSGGFVKNYAGAVSKKAIIVGAKMLLMAIQNVLTLFFAAISLYVICAINGNTEVDLLFVGKYFVCTYLTGLVCSFFAMMLSELTRKTVSTILLVICISSGLFSQLAGMISLLISNGTLNLSNYMTTGVHARLMVGSTDSDFLWVIGVAVFYLIGTAVISAISVQKRDVV